MKIGFFTDTFLPQFNGVVTAINDFGNELSRRGHEIHVFCPSATHNGSDYKIGKMHIHTFPSVSFRPYPDYRIGIPLSLKRIPRLDIVHAHSPFLFGLYGLRAARNQGVPCICTFYTLISEFAQYLGIPDTLHNRISWAYLRMHHNKYDAITTLSFTIKDILEKHGFKQPIEVLPLGVNTKYFHPVKNARNRLGINASQVYLYVGRLSHEKHVDVLIRASKQFLDKDDVLLIVGKGPTEASLRELAKNDRRIIFTGFVEHENLPLYYSASDAFLTASTCETQGLTSFEAMACGCPVIGKNVLATGEVVEHGKNGYLWNTRPELASTIRSLNRRKLSQLSKNAQKSAKNYSIPRCTDRLEQLYNSTISRQKSPSKQA